MGDFVTRDAGRSFIDKRRIQQVVAQQNEKMGFVPDLAVTPEEAQEAVERSLRENGLRPEDNIFSCGIIAAREE
jgi:2-C-methyl-D-erythritol 4-phosphate cytidylyltransferase